MSCPAYLKRFWLAGIVVNIVHIGWDHPLASANMTRRLFTMTSKPCQDVVGNVGVCMFKWDCISQKGISLSTCVDGFLFGACCKLKVPTPQTTYGAISNVNDIDVGQVAPENQMSSLSSQVYNTTSYDDTLKRIFPVASSTLKSTYLTSITFQNIGTDHNGNSSTDQVDSTSSITKSRTEDIIYSIKENSSLVKMRDRNTSIELSKNSAIFSENKKPNVNNNNNNTDHSDTNLNAYNKNESSLLIPDFSANFINSTDNSNSVISFAKNELTSDQGIYDDYESYLNTDAFHPEDYTVTVDVPVSVELESKNETFELMSVDASSNDSTIYSTQSDFFSNASNSTNEEKKTGTHKDSENLLPPASSPFINSDYLNITANYSFSSYIQVNLTEERSNVPNNQNYTDTLFSNTSNTTTITVNTLLVDCNGTYSLKILDKVNNFIDNSEPAKSKIPYTTQKLENIYKLQKPIETLIANDTLSTDYIMLPEASTVTEIQSSTPRLETSILLFEDEKPMVNSDLIAEVIPEIKFFNNDSSVNLIENINTTAETDSPMFQTTFDDANTFTFSDISVVEETNDTLFLPSTLRNSQLVQINNTTDMLNEIITEEYSNNPNYETTPTSHVLAFSAITAPVNASVKPSTYFEMNENENIIETTQNIFKTVNDNKEIINDIEFSLYKFTTIYPKDNITHIRNEFLKDESLNYSFTSELSIDDFTSKSSNELSSASQEFSSLLVTAEHDTKFISTTEMIIDKVQPFIAFINESKQVLSTDFQESMNNSLDQTTNIYAQEDNITSSAYANESEILIETTTATTIYSVPYVATDVEEDSSGQNLGNVSSSVPLDVTWPNYSSTDNTLTNLNVIPTDEDISFQQTMYYENISSIHDSTIDLITQEPSTIYNSSIVSTFNLSTSAFSETMNTTAESADNVLELSSSNIVRNITNVNEPSATTQIVPLDNTSSFVTPHNEQITTSPYNTASIYEGLTTASQFLNDKRGCGVRLLRPFGRIVGGHNTYFGKWPWQALVKEATWLGLFVKNKCGGVLINSKYVITAAHCQPGFLATLVVILGAHDLTGMIDGKTIARNVRRMVVHRHYNPQTFENDLALLEMESPIDFLPHVVPICLPNRNEDFTGKMAYVTGWGKLTHGGNVPNILQEVQVPIVTNRDCQKMFLLAGHQKAIRNNFVCAGYRKGGQDSCEGDSGGPLVVQRDNKRWMLVGTVSHGIGCADANLPGVYMKMSAYRSWIDSIINK